MGKALYTGLAIAACFALAASSVRAQEREEFQFVPELPRFEQSSTLELYRNGGSLRLGGDWEVSAESLTFRPTERVRVRYEELYFEREISNDISFQIGATRHKFREHELSFRDVTYGVRWTFRY